MIHPKIKFQCHRESTEQAYYNWKKLFMYEFLFLLILQHLLEALELASSLFNKFNFIFG